jgi:hypothetical protein
MQDVRRGGRKIESVKIDMRHEIELPSSELEMSKNLGFAIGDALSDLPVSQQLYAAVMCVAHIINSGSLDAHEARKVLDDFRDTVDLELTALRALLAA